MPQARPLRIAKTIPNKVRLTGYHTVLYVKLILFAIFLYSYTHEAKVESTVFYPGHRNQQLLHNIETWKKERSANYPSSWRAKEPYINGSSYRVSIYDGLSWILLAFFDLGGAFKVAASFLQYMLHFYYSVSQWSVKRFGVRNLVLYLVFCITVSLLATFGGCEIVLTLSRITLDKIIKWLESNIIIFDTRGDGDISIPRSGSYKQKHPATKGDSPPYYLYTFYRYNNEDAIFQCEYIVSLSEENARPVYKTSGWRKHGVPVIPNEKIQVDIQIRPLEYWEKLNLMISPLRPSFSILSTLTIALINDNDYGAYTCDYSNPMRVLVRPGHKMSEAYNNHKMGYGLSSPDSKCGCKSHTPPSHNCDMPKTQTAEQECRQERFSSNKQSQCFAEFLLKKAPDVTTPMAVNPGSILIHTTFYTTVADENDIEYDVTSFSKDSEKHNCCSIFVKVYWALSQSFYVSEFPYSRLFQAPEGFLFQRGQCLCKSSFGTMEFSLQRRFYNVSAGSSDMVNVLHPFKLQLIPDINPPFSETDESDTKRFANLTECLDSNRSSSHCDFQDYLLEKAIEQFFQYCDIILFHVIAYNYLITGILIIFIPQYLCILPIANYCLNYGRGKVQFDAVKGPPLETLKPCRIGNLEHNGDFGENEENGEAGNPGGRITYDVCLSYDDEEPYDLKLAQLLKTRLLAMKCSVFDVMTDIPYGRCLLTETARAIQNSSRFVIVASQSYIENMVLEFDVIQSTIVSQYSVPKYRLLIISVEPCEIVGLQRVPCIHLPRGLKDRDVIDQHSLIKFDVWEKSTRPLERGEVPCLGNSPGPTKRVFPFSVSSVCSWTIFLTLFCFTIKMGAYTFP